MKPGDLIKLKSFYISIYCVEANSAENIEWTNDQIGLYLNWSGSYQNGKTSLARILVNDHICIVDESKIETFNGWDNV